MKLSIVLLRRKRCGTHHYQAVGSRHCCCQYDNTVRRGQVTTYILVFISVINQLDAQNLYFTISLFHASTCFEHVLELCIGMK